MDVSEKFQLYYGPKVPYMIEYEKRKAEEDPEFEAPDVHFRAATRSDKYMVHFLIIFIN